MSNLLPPLIENKDTIEKTELFEKLSQFSSIISTLNGYQPGEIVLLCSFLMGSLAAQLPITASAFVEGMTFFKNATTRLLESPEVLAELRAQGWEDGQLLMLNPTDIGNAEDNGNVIIVGSKVEAVN